MEESQPDHEVRKAPRACHSCKVRKRKCDKQLPECSLCSTKKWSCNYSHQRMNSYGSDAKRSDFVRRPESDSPVNTGNWSALRTPESITEPGPQRQEYDFPAVFFLDSDVFQRGRIEIPSPFSLPIPSYVLEYIGNTDEIRNMASKYFQTFHTWMPFISRKRFYENLLNPLSRPQPDHFLLFFCMKLTLWIPIEDAGPKTVEYLAAKRFQSELETSGIFTVPALQASILISLYEIGHAIYPSAYTSIGNCVRLAVALGVDRRKRDFRINGQLDWVELEERTRIWWTILIIDRFVNLGCPSRSLVTQAPQIDDPLPTDEAAWEQGTPTTDDSTSLSSPRDTKMCQFARLAQAVNLYSLVLTHLSETPSGTTFGEEEVMQLDRTLHSLIDLAESELWSKDLRTCAGVGICRSALTILHTHYLQRSGMNPTYRSYAMNTLKRNSDQLVLYLRKTLSENMDAANKVPHLSLHWIYQAAIIQVRFNRDRNLEDLTSFKLLRTSLRILGKRWLAAGAYLRILEARDIMDFY